MSEQPRFVIGWWELADLPALGLEKLRAKIDTGAYTGALHCHEIKVLRRGKKSVLSFTLLDPTHPKYQKRRLGVTHFTQKFVKNSSGTREKRYAIRTVIRFCGEVHDIELTLSDRSELKFPLLLGRKFLKRNYLIDVSRQNIFSPKKKKKKARRKADS